MSDLTYDQLTHKIQQAVELIKALRTDNAELKKELHEVSRSVQKKKVGLGKSSLQSEQAKMSKKEVQSLLKERKEVKQKIRNVLRKLDEIRLEDDAKVQKDLFDSE